MIKLLLTIIISFCCLATFAQKLRVKNTANSRVYKLAYLKHVWIKPYNSSKEFSVYIKEAKNDTLFLLGDSKIALADIYSIRFTPKNVFARIGKPVLYGLGILVSGIISSSVQAQEHTYSATDRWLMFGSGMLYSSFLIETTAIGFWIITPKGEFISGINLEITESR